MTMPNITSLSLKEAKVRIGSNSMPKSQLQATLLQIVEALLTKSNDVSNKVALLGELYENNRSTLQIPNIEIELQYVLAICYREGLGIGMDCSKARQMFINIIEGYPNSISKLHGTAHPHSYAMVELAFFNINSGSPENIEGALNFLLTAAAHGNSLAQYHLARLFKKGQFVEASPKKANEYLLLAAKAGLAVAQYDLAVQLVISSKQDNDGKNPQATEETLKLAGDKIREAYHWFKLAAANGYSKANYYLGRYYQQGYTEILQKDFGRAAEHYLVFLQQASNKLNEGYIVESIILKGIYDFANNLLTCSTSDSQNREYIQLGLKLMHALVGKNYKEAEVHIKAAQAVTVQHSQSSAGQYNTSRSASHSPYLTKIDSPLQAGTHEGVGRTPSPIELGNSPTLSSKQNSSLGSSASHSYSSEGSMILDNQDAENDANIECAGNEGLSDSDSIPSPNTPNVKTNADTVDLVSSSKTSLKSLKSLRIPRPNADPALVNAPFKPPKPLSPKVSGPLLDITNLNNHALVFAPFKAPKQNQSSASFAYCETWAKKMLDAQAMKYAKSMHLTPQKQKSALTFMPQAQHRQNLTAKSATSATASKPKMEIPNMWNTNPQLSVRRNCMID